MVSEPIVFNYLPFGELLNLPTVTLLINPETLTLNWTKVITRVRTKSRIVSLYWGQEPVNFTYVGQTGNLYPSKELIDKARNENDSRTRAIDSLLVHVEELKAEYGVIKARLDNALTAGDVEIAAELQDTLDSIQISIDTSNAEISSLRTLVNATSLTSDVRHTALISLSAKYQAFQRLEALFQDSQNVSTLMKVQYRDFIFEGYFENFGFTDDGRNPWNRPYSLSFTTLNWDREFTATSSEIILIGD